MSQNTSFFTLLPPSPYLPLSERTGELPFMLTNDYMFKVVLQTDETILCALLCSLLDLTQTALATEHDRQSGLTRWAAAFKAKTWEEYQMLAEEDVLFQKVSDALYLISENREIAEQCRRMQEAEAMRKRMEEQEAQQIERENALDERENTLADRESTLADKESDLDEQANALAQQKSALDERANMLAQQENALAQQKHDLMERDRALAEKQAELDQLMAQLRKYQQE